MRRPLRRLAGCALAGAALTACSSSTSHVSTGATTTTAPPAATTTSAAPSPPTTTAPLVGGGVTPVSTPSQGHAKLVAVRVGDQGGFDRVTFEFSGGLPGYKVQYVPRPIQEDPTGKTVDVQGDSVLSVRFAGASGVDLSGGKVTQTYTGPKRLPSTTASVAELVETGDFEDVLNWAVGTHGHPAFKVGQDAAGLRIVIDIAH